MKRLLLTAFILCAATMGCSGPPGTPIKVGILHSLTGTMAISERSLVDATLLAITEINGRGGLLGRQIQPVTVDGRSDWPTFGRVAVKLVQEEKVSVIFGCWTSASRKTVRPIVEKYNQLLFYPLQYEGLEQSPNIIYTGAAPNQQILPAVEWSCQHLGKRAFLVGSDYVFPRTANAIIKDKIHILGGQIVGEDYIILGSKDVRRVVDKIVKSRPDVIFNTINGDSNVAFFESLRAAGITPNKVPTMSFSIAEDELRGLNAGTMAGDYAAWNYFQSLGSKENRAFVAKFKAKYGAARVTDDPIEAAYFGVFLWAQAVQDAGSDEVAAVRKAVLEQSFAAPEGVVYVDPENQHTWKTVRMGKIRGDGQFDVLWTSERPIRPVPFPLYRSRAEWNRFTSDLFAGWGNRWANPGQR